MKLGSNIAYWSFVWHTDVCVGVGVCGAWPITLRYDVAYYNPRLKV